MERTKVIDSSYQIHALRHGRCPARRTSRAAAQDRQTTAERAIQPLNECGIEHLTSGCTPQQGQKHLNAPLHQAMDRARYRAPGVLFDDLGDRQIGPTDQARATAGSRLTRPKRLVYRINVGHQTIAHEQQRPEAGTRRHQGDHPTNQVAVTPLRDRAAQPQAGCDHQCHCHPQHTGLRLDMHLIGLYVMQIARLHDHTMVKCFGMRSGGIDPFAHSLGLQLERGFNRGNGTAMTDQGNKPRNQLLIRPSAKEDRAASGTEALLTYRAAVALPLLTMDANVSFAKLPSCRTVDIRAKCRLRIDDTPLFGPKHRRVSLDPLTFSSPMA